MVLDMVTAAVAAAPSRPLAPTTTDLGVIAPSTGAPDRPRAQPGFGGADVFERGGRPLGQLHVEKSAAATGATGGAAIAVPSHVSDLVAQSTGAVQKDFRAVSDAIKKGDYQTASTQVAALFKKDEAIEAQLGSTGVDQTEGLKGQVEFLAKMQKQGVRADFPPTERQLTDYFTKLAGDPAQAKASFQEYVSAFHVNPKQAGTGEEQVTYTEGKSVRRTQGGKDHDVPVQNPTSWKEVTTDRDQIKSGRYAGASVNDCEGYALMGEKLLGAAGFKVESYVVGHGPQMGHQMLLMKDPKGKPAVISNDRVFSGASAAELQRQGLAFAFDGAEGAGNGKLYTGKSMAEAQIAYTLAHAK